MIEGYPARFSRPYLFLFIFYEFLKFSITIFNGHTVDADYFLEIQMISNTITDKDLLGYDFFPKWTYEALF